MLPLPAITLVSAEGPGPPISLPVMSRLRSSFVRVTPISPIWSGPGVFEAAERRFRDVAKHRDTNLYKVVEISLADSRRQNICPTQVICSRRAIVCSYLAGEVLSLLDKGLGYTLA